MSLRYSTICTRQYIVYISLLSCICTQLLAQSFHSTTTNLIVEQSSVGDLNYRVQLMDNTLFLRRRGSQQILIEQSQQQFTVTRDHNTLAPDIHIQIAPGGYSVVYAFSNNTSSPKPLPDLRVGPIYLGNTVTYQDIRHCCNDVNTNASSYKTTSQLYPADMYSPVWIIRNHNQACGISLDYPIMEYKHDAKFILRYNKQQHGWLVDIRLSNHKNDLLYSAAVPPGQTWTYTVNVRFTPKSNEWVRTLLPYREYFLSTYGSLQYTRQVAPVNAASLASNESITNDNPRGFDDQALRPDLVGYSPVVTDVLSRQGWPSYMIATPSGLYYNNTQQNDPFRFASPWTTDTHLNTALDPDVGFPRFPASGKQLGFWWPHAARVVFQWDPDQAYPLEPSNPQHKQAAFHEIDLAVQAGATVIVLGDFDHRTIPIWQAVRWLEILKARYPQLHFVVSPMPCDMMHTKAAGWLQAYNDDHPVSTIDQLNFVKGPHILADFLLPGHETWAGWRYKGHQKYLNMTPDQDLVNNDAARFAKWGYRPMIETDLPLTVHIQAAPSWRTSIPQDIQLNPTNTTIYIPPQHASKTADSSPSRSHQTKKSYGVHISRNTTITPQEAERAIQRARNSLGVLIPSPDSKKKKHKRRR